MSKDEVILQHLARTEAMLEVLIKNQGIQNSLIVQMELNGPEIIIRIAQLEMKVKERTEEILLELKKSLL